MSDTVEELTVAQVAWELDQAPAMCPCGHAWSVHEVVYGCGGFVDCPCGLSDGAPTKDVGPRTFRTSDVPVSLRCVAGQPFHIGACRNADGQVIHDEVRDALADGEVR